MTRKPASATFLVIGDVHNHWRDADRAFVEGAGADLALFVGDFGDEDVAMVRAIAEVQAPKAVMLGNHDAWQSFSRKEPTPALREIVAMLGDEHLAYGLREVPAAGLSVIGGRPYSWGGRSLRSEEVYGALHDVTTHEESAARILDAARRAKHQDVMILAHNGPLGLGGKPGDIYGKDFGKSPGGDWGDRDLELAIEGIRKQGLRLRAVVAGHMHHRLTFPRGKYRTRFLQKDGTWFVNPAVVPRIRKDPDGVELAHFVRMRWSAGELEAVEEVWVDEAGREVVARQEV